MRAAHRIARLLFLFPLIVGCGSDDPAEPGPGLTLDELVGSWIATSATHTNNVDAAQTFDIVAAGGEVRFTMLAGGGTRTWVELGSLLDEWDSQATLNGNIATMVPVEAGRPTRVWTVQLSGGVLTLTNTDSEFDFTLMNATPVSTREVVVLIPN